MPGSKRLLAQTDHNMLRNPWCIEAIGVFDELESLVRLLGPRNEAEASDIALWETPRGNP